MRLFSARSLAVAPGVLHAGGGVLCDERVREVATSPSQVRRLADRARVEVEDLGDVVLAPGLVDAHVHLELTGIDPGPARTFRGWVEGLMGARRELSLEALVAGAARGADRLLAGGTLVVGDISSTPASATALAGRRLRATLYREVLDAGAAERTAGALGSLEEPLDLRDGLREGISPHAPYTVTPQLFIGLGRLARRRALPVAIHWAETEEEVEWMLHGTGPLAGLVSRSPGRPGLDLIEQAGLLRADTSLVHGNCPAPGELERVARAGSVCVHCPGSHVYFERKPFPFELYERAGVPVALGTDSAASNADLDMRREMALFRSAHPQVAAARVWEMATVHAARAVGLRGEPGTLRVGALADFCAFALRPRSVEDCFDALTAGSPAVEGCWIGGRPASGTVA